MATSAELFLWPAACVGISEYHLLQSWVNRAYTVYSVQGEMASAMKGMEAQSSSQPGAHGVPPNRVRSGSLLHCLAECTLVTQQAPCLGLGHHQVILAPLWKDTCTDEVGGAPVEEPDQVLPPSQWALPPCLSFLLPLLSFSALRAFQLLFIFFYKKTTETCCKFTATNRRVRESVPER